MRLDSNFYNQNAATLAKELLGKIIVRKWENDSITTYIITETEAYLGENDIVFHASKGQTPCTEIMYTSGGNIYVYLIYGIHWLLNVVTGIMDHPEAVLIRGIDNII